MYQIGELARRAGVSRDTLRFYEREGLLPPSPRSQGGYRLYGPDALTRLQFIRQAQRLSFSLQEIGSLIEIMAGGAPPCTHVRALLRDKVAKLDRQLAKLTALRDALSGQLSWAENHPEPSCDGQDHCIYLDPPSPLP